MRVIGVRYDATEISPGITEVFVLYEYGRVHRGGSVILGALGMPGCGKFAPRKLANSEKGF